MTYRAFGPSQADYSARSYQPFFSHRFRFQSGVNSVKGNLTLNPYHTYIGEIHSSGYYTYAPPSYCTHFFRPDSANEVSIDNKKHYLVRGYRTPSGWNSSLLNTNHLSLSSNELNALRASLQKRVTEASMELLVSLKELPETIRMILSGFQRLNNILIAARQKNLSAIGDELGLSRRRGVRRRWKRNLERSYHKRPGPKDPINGVSGLYLEAVFGWNSMYQETISAAEFMASLTAKMPKERCFSTGPVKREESTSTSNRHNADRDTFAGTLTISKETKFRLDATFRPSWGTALTAAGINISSVWQIIPYSFIVNWFADITSFLRQFELLNSLVDLQCTLTKTTRVDAHFSGTASEWYSRRYFRDTSASVKLVSMTRAYESPYITFPPVRLPLGIGKGISAIALIAQKFTK